MDKARRRPRRSPAYTLARSLQLQLRNLRDPDRPLPAFIIIGAHKAGTTSFYKNLAAHPQIGAAWTKEVHYFDRAPPPVKWSAVMFRKTEDQNGSEAAQTRRNCHEAAAG